MGAQCGRRAAAERPAAERQNQQIVSRWTRATAAKAVRWRWFVAGWVIVRILKVRRIWSRTGKALNQTKKLFDRVRRKKGKLVYRVKGQVADSE